MTKIFSTLIIICFLSIPLALWGQIDYLWMVDDMLLEEAAEEEITLNAFELYWSTDTYVPFGYQGRKLPTQGSLVTLEAYLDTSGGNPMNLKYSWFLDDIFQGAKSGYGRDSFQFYIRRFENASHTVLLKVFNESRSFLVEKSITIPVTKPELVVYHKNTSRINLPYITSPAGFGIAAGKESAFLALPYFFNIKSLKDLEFEWALGEKSVKESSLIANVFGLKIINKEAEGSLEETLKVIATNKKQTNQRVRRIIKIYIY